MVKRNLPTQQKRHQTNIVILQEDNEYIFTKMVLSKPRRHTP